MRPVAAKFPVSQGFGGGATQGVDPYGNDPMAALVRLYGNYQPFGHAGEDIACPVGTPVYAMASGTVLWADWGTNLPGDESDWGYRQRFYLYKGFPGIVTVIQHPWGKGVYAHLSSNDPAPKGTTVREGQLIGYSGDTGGVAPHLHVEALINDSYITQGGLIYGRTNPASFYGTITPQSTTTAPAKDWFDMATEAQLRKIIQDENPWGYKNAKLEKDDAYALLRATRTNAVKAASNSAATNAQIGGLVGALKAVANGEKFDEAKLLAGIQAAAEAGAKKGAASAIGEGVDFDATLTVKKAL